MNDFIKFFEIPATNVERAIKFYATVFDIEIKLCDCGSEKMGMFPGGIGAISQSEGFEPSKNGVLLSLNGGNDLNFVLEKVKLNNGKVIVKKTKIEVDKLGYFAVFQDTEGNRLGLYSDN